jgi:hypothetical protein
MFTNIFKRRIDADAKGVGFDQHYTDSTLKLLVPKSYRRHETHIGTRKAVPKQEILSSLLLFGKAYLSKPTWLFQPDPYGFPYHHDYDFSELERFERENLIEWIPETIYESAKAHLKPLIEKLWERAYWESQPSVIRERRTVRHPERYQLYLLKREEIESTLSHNILVMLEEVFYVLPLIRANLNHFKLELPDALTHLLYPIDAGDPDLFPTDVLNDDDPYRPDSFLDKLFPETINSREEYILSAVLESLLSSLAIERFAADTSVPIKTSGSTKSLKMGKTMLGLEAYQLVKIQFHDLRYPVIESVEDVLRLRDDPHLRTYRLVIAEYSERLRQELESERSRIISDFRKDIQSALKSLVVVKRWSKIVDLSFFISLPLVIIGALYGLPLSDILVVPLTSYAKIVAHQKRKELDWILFGRSDNA